MADLIVDVEEKIVQALEERAVRNGRTPEEEHLAILRHVLLGEWYP